MDMWRLRSTEPRWSPDLTLDKENHDSQGILAAAKGRLVKVPHLTVQRIWCEFQSGHLVLRGHVPSYYHKQLAQEAVAGLGGVTQVINDIEVIW